jgi:hypothetical protein
MKTILILILNTLFLHCSYAQNWYGNVKTEKDEIAGSCVKIISPAPLKGTRLCKEKGEAKQAGVKRGYFIEENKLIIAGAGIPVDVTENHIGMGIILSGEGLCAIEDIRGMHQAGARCFYGVAQVGKDVISLLSQPISIEKSRNNIFKFHKKHLENWLVLHNSLMSKN